MAELPDYMVHAMKVLYFSDKPAPTLPEICRANIDAGHNTEGDWAAYIDACLDRQMATGIPTPVLMDSFECAAGWGAMAVRAGAELGLWRQEPWRSEGPLYSWSDSGKKIALHDVSRHLWEKKPFFLLPFFGRDDEAKADLLRAMTEYAHAEVKKSITAQR